MTNEEIVERIQNGDPDLMGDLWKRVFRFIKLKAKAYVTILDECGAWCGLDADDFIQIGYFALEDAVRGYDPEKASFIHYLSFHLHHHFSAAVNKARRNPLIEALSLDFQIDDRTRADFVEDPADSIRTAEDRIFRKQLQRDLDRALERINDEDARTLRLIYYDGKTVPEIARANGEKPSTVRTRKDRGIRELKRLSRRLSLDKYLDLRTPFYRRTDFRHTFTSPVEASVIARAELIKGLSGNG